MTRDEEKTQLLSALTLVLLFFLGFGLYSWISDDKKIEKSSGEISETQQYAWVEKGKDAVRERLKDPESAQFKDTFFHHNKAYSPVACGQVNSKNSHGGYVGFQRFVSAGKPEFTFLENDMKNIAEFNKTWTSLCQEHKGNI